ncbi:MAG: hypothetical protein LKI92_09750 [Schleiferilactobacillus harbinensis]|jgi:hypothetical protein|nr:hypothetical protein [Schleiferilactobacillus harbinensis]MCI1913292.1 hypothetical protein [Schleiferilactobacillus harbinensis]
MNQDSLGLKIAKIVVFAISIFLVVYGHTKIGYPYLGMELLGLTGILLLLWQYNRKYV